MGLETTDDQERRRLEQMLRYEQQALSQGYQLIAGIDEAGRGPLAGPVVAAACILPKGLSITNIDDSKKLTPRKRAEIFREIKENSHILYGVGIVDVEDIDLINILQATIKAMLLAVSALPVCPDYLLVDGLQLRTSIPSLKIIKGDQLSQSIAAASIIAKETRDEIMKEHHAEWSYYGFDQNKGYGTQKHFEAIEKFGMCKIHRKSFEPIKSMIEKGRS